MGQLYALIKKGWFALGHVLGWINTRVLLSLIYALPLGLYAIVSMFARSHPRSTWKEYPEQVKTLEALGNPF